MKIESAKEMREFDIVEVKEWKDRNSGMTVIEHIPLTPNISKNVLTLIDNKPTRYGKAHIPTQMGPIAFQFVFPEEYSLMECFEHFEEWAEKAVEEMEKEANNKIIIPQGVNANALRTK